MAIVAASAIIVLALVVSLLVPTCSRGADEVDTAVNEPTKVSFVAVGDNLPSEFVGRYADRQAGSEGDGTYDYRSIYAPIKSYVEDADIAYVNQEVHVGGDEIGPQGYPSFNTTDEMADAIVDTGFDFVASATNHSYDWGLSGALEHSLSVWDKQPVAFTGTAVTEEQYNRIATVEREGITFALLNYTYAVGGFEREELPKYAVNYIDEAKIRTDVQRARDEAGADVVLVAMHWGTENLTEADEEQQRLAQFLADLDVDVVLGSHPHVIGPLAWVENSSGSGHRTLVAYSLGNFLSDHESPNAINELEGMLTCDFVKNPVDSGEDGASSGSAENPEGSSGAESGDFTVSVENVRWVPLVCHSNAERTEFAVYAVQDYTEELAKENRVFTESDDPLGWLDSTTASIIDPEWLE